MRKGQVTVPVRVRSCLVVKNKASGRFTRRISPGVPVRRAVTSGNQGTLSGDVPRLWCSGRQHATCALVLTRKHVNQHQPLVDATSRLLKRMSVRHHVESDAFDVDTEVLVDVLIERGDLRDAS